MTQPTHVSGTIKPLEWEGPNPEGDFRAHHQFGWYVIYIVDRGHLLSRGGVVAGVFGTADVAKAAAQADCEARIAAQIQPDAEPLPDTSLRYQIGEIGNQIHNLSCEPQASEAGELLPCPFCGSDPERITIGDDDPSNAGGDVISCTGCLASSHVEFGRKENLESCWNRRALPAARAEVSVAEAATIPEDVVELILRIGRAEWGATAAKSAEEHAADLINSIRLTDEHFKTEGPHRMDGLYIEGTETVLCHSGTSPNSPAIAQTLTGAWNRLHDEATALRAITEAGR